MDKNSLQKERIYDMRDASAREEKRYAMELCRELNMLPPEEVHARLHLMKELFGSIGESPNIMPGFHCDSGKNIRIGNDFLANYNVTILDRMPVLIGNNVMLAPNVVITTTGHPLDPEERREHIGIAKAITIGNDVWIGANAVILPGVTIGSNVVVAAGAVVTKDIPDNSLVAGIPAHIVRNLS